jgi:ElaB/YqjD/DUF883 family membrane-anchored ribosome-binding protein
VTQNDNDNKNSNIHIGGSVQGGNVNIGGTQTFHGSVTITQGDIQQMSGSSDEKAELQRLLDQLQKQLEAAPAEQKAEADKIAKRSNELVEEAKAENPDKEAIEAKANLLKKAAENVRDVMPAVTMTALGVVTTILKLAGVS